MARNRVIYQSEALFVNHQYSGHQTIDITAGHTVGATAATAPGITADAFHQIARVQNANYSFSINRTDINQFGNLARIDTAVIEAPTVSLDFSYLLTDGTNGGVNRLGWAMVISKIAKSGEPAQSERGYHESPALIGDGVSYLGHGLQVGRFYPGILYARRPA